MKDPLRNRNYLLICLLLSLSSGCQGPGLRSTPQPLFDGQTLQGWQGLVGNPYSRAEMSPPQLAEAQRLADQQMRAHWSVDQGMLVFDGHGSHLCTIEPFSDFELEVDWMI